MRARTLVLAGSTLLYLGLGCKPPQQYAWHNYEASLYKLAKDPSALDKYGADLLDQIQAGEPTRRVPPGIYAEYGYFLLSNHRVKDAVAYFQKEKDRWPEAKVYMDLLIKRALDPAIQGGKA